MVDRSILLAGLQSHGNMIKKWNTEFWYNTAPPPPGCSKHCLTGSFSPSRWLPKYKHQEGGLQAIKNEDLAVGMLL